MLKNFPFLDCQRNYSIHLVYYISYSHKYESHKWNLHLLFILYKAVLQINILICVFYCCLNENFGIEGPIYTQQKAKTKAKP